jgi:mannosyltransferase OCH1-like enzyme
MIPKLIHQIYFNLHNKEIEDIPLFKKSSDKIQELHPDYKYILWTEKECDELVKEKLPQYYKFYKSMRYDIQRIDYMRFVIL